MSRCIGIHKFSGRIDLPDEDVRHCVQAFLAHAADPQYRVHAVGGKFAEFHRIGAVYEHDDRVKIRAHLFEHLSFDVLQGEILRSVPELSGDEVRAFAADAGQRDDRRIAVQGIAVAHLRRIDAHVRFEQVEGRRTGEAGLDAIVDGRLIVLVCSP